MQGVLILPFCLIKKVRKNQDQTMLLPTGLYAGPPFGRAVAFVLCGFYHPGLRPALRGRGMGWASMLPHPQNIVPGGGIIGAYVFSFHGPVFFIAFGSHADGAAAVVAIQLIH